MSVEYVDCRDFLIYAMNSWEITEWFRFDIPEFIVPHISKFLLLKLVDNNG